MDMKKENSELIKMNSDFDEQALDALIQEALTEDMHVVVPDSFADKMEAKAKRINVLRFWQEEFLKHAILLGGAIVMIAIVFGVFFYFSPENTNGFILFVVQFKWIILGSLFFIFAIQLVDSWIAKKLGFGSA
jgi:vacuolar-type H+-ATPase subunit I/STV1